MLEIGGGKEDTEGRAEERARPRRVRRRKPAELARDRLRIAELYLAGKTQHEIGEILERDQSTISKDIAAMHRDWLGRSDIQYAEAKARELAKIDNLERQYWAAWERSQQKREETTTETVDASGGGVDRVRAQIKEFERDGNPTFLGGVQWCIEQRMRIFGLAAPVKVAPTDPSGQYPASMRARDLGMTDDDRRREILEILAAAAGRSVGPGAQLENGHGTATQEDAGHD